MCYVFSLTRPFFVVLNMMILSLKTAKFEACLLNFIRLVFL